MPDLLMSDQPSDSLRLQFLAMHPECVRWLPEKQLWIAHEPDNPPVPMRIAGQSLMVPDETRSFLTRNEFSHLIEAIDWAMGGGQSQRLAEVSAMINSLRKQAGHRGLK